MAKQNTSATMATNSMDHSRGSVCTVEFGMAAYRLANVCFLVPLFPVALCSFLPSAIYCPDLDHPQYGSVKIIGKNVGGKAEYKCNYGYKLYGASFRKCLYGGIWDGSQPTCKRRFLFPLYSVVASSGFNKPFCRPSCDWLTNC